MRHNSTTGTRLLRCASFLCLFTVLWGIPATAWAAAPAPAPYRIIMVESGPSREFQRTLAALARHLERRGLIADGNVPIPDDTESTAGMWAWLAANAGGKHLVFAKNGWYSGEHDNEQRKIVQGNVLHRIHEEEDVNLLLVFGTKAGLDLATREHAVPTLALAITDPVSSGVVASLDDSGLDNVYAPADPQLYSRQLKVFHEVFRFKLLGVPCEDSAEGRAIINLAEIDRMAEELGFKTRLCLTPPESDPDKATEALLGCLERMAPEVDAVYLTFHRGMNQKRMTEILAPLIKYGLPSFSQDGIDEAKLGVLMSLSEEAADSQARAAALAVERILAGASPRSLRQQYASSPGLALNLRMAMLIGWRPPLEMLVAVDSIHREIKNISAKQEAKTP